MLTVLARTHVVAGSVWDIRVKYRSRSANFQYDLACGGLSLATGAEAS